MRPRLLITGSTGLLGATLVAAASDGFEVVACQRRPRFFPSRACTATLDIADAASVLDVVTSSRPAAIVHCAAVTRVDWCEDHEREARLINVDGTANLCRAAVVVDARMVYISTDSVFNGRRGNYAEEDEPDPVNAYARSKWLGEQITRAEAPEHLIVRTNFYGWNHGPNQSLGEWILDRLRSGHSLKGFTDVVFSPLVTDDLADRLLAMLERGARGTYHLGASDAVSKFEFARRVARTFGLDESLVEPASVDSLGLTARRPKVTNLNPSKAAGLLGSPMPTVEEGMRRFHEIESSGELARRRSQWMAGSAAITESVEGRA